MDESELPRGVTAFDASPAHVHFDGACDPPKGGGVAAWGYTVEVGGLYHEECGLATRPYSPHATNNVAEYVGAIRALEWLHAQGYRGPVVVSGDSQLVVRQVNGTYRVRAEHLKAYHERLLQLASEFAHVEFVWVRREQNQRADALSKQALEEAAADASRYRPSRPREVPGGDPSCAGLGP